jgi:hypothetical protein
MRTNLARTFAPTADVDVGDEVLVLLDEPQGRSLRRRTLLGAARGRVVARARTGGGADLFRVAVTAASPEYFVGRQLAFARSELYAEKDRAERMEFESIVSFAWRKEVA